MIVEIPLTDEMRELAGKKARSLGKLRNSIRKGEGNLVGFLGEIAVAYLFNGELINDYDHDVLALGMKMEVKTKETTVTPRLDYEGSVATCNLKQDCDLYVFVRVSDDLQTAWLCGMIRNDEFKSRARRLKKGERDGSNNFKVRQDCLNMFYSDMAVPEKVIKYAMKNGLRVFE